MTDKITFSPVQSGTESVLQLNDNFEKIRKTLNEDVLYRNNPLGTPNDIKQDLDFNLKNILNAREIDAKFIKIDGVDATDSLKNDLQAIKDLTARSETAATSAETSETNAATSASNAATSETNAAASASAAGTSETNAATSETNAATSETNAANSATAAAASEVDAEAALTDLNSVYLRSSSTDPTTDLNGNPLTEGDIYYNTTDKNLRYFNGTTWSSDVDALQATQQQAEDGTDNTTYMSPLRVNQHRKFREDLQNKIERDSTLILNFAENRYRIYEGLQDGHTLKPFNSALTYSRLSNAKGFSALRVLDNALDDQQRLVFDPVTGESLGLFIEGSATNSLLHNRDLSNAVWTGAATAAKDAVGLDGVANTAHTVTDASTAEIRNLSQDIAIADDNSSHTVSFFVKKEADTSSFPALSVVLAGAGTNIIYDVVLNKSDGSFVLGGSATSGNSKVKDRGSFWEIVITATNNTSGKTTLRYFITPALNSNGTATADAVATGTVIYDYGQVILNSTVVGSPILTTTAAADRAADVASQGEVEKWFNSGEMTIIVKGSAAQLAEIRYFFDSNSTTNEDRFAILLLANNRVDFFTFKDGVGRSFQPQAAVINDAEQHTLLMSISEKEGLKVGALDGQAFSVSHDLKPKPTTFHIGKRHTNVEFLGGPLAEIVAIPRFFNEAEAAEATKP